MSGGLRPPRMARVHVWVGAIIYIAGARGGLITLGFSFYLCGPTGPFSLARRALGLQPARFKTEF